MEINKQVQHETKTLHKRSKNSIHGEDTYMLNSNSSNIVYIFYMIQKRIHNEIKIIKKKGDEI